MKTNEEIVADFQRGDPDALEALWKQNERGVAYVADKVAAAGLGEPEDLKQEGFFGLLRAAELFDPAEGASFMTYAWPWIRQAIYSRGGETRGTIRLPPHMREKIIKYRRFVSDFSRSAGCEPNDLQIQHYLQIGPQLLENIRKAMKVMYPESLDGPAGRTDDLTLGDVLPGDNNMEEDIIRHLDREKMAQDLDELIRSMSQEKQAALHAEYWEERQLSPDERKRHREALSDLQRPANKRILRPYYEQYMGNPYKGGLQRFRSTGESIVETLALKHLDARQAYEVLRDHCREEIEQDLRPHGNDNEGKE